MEFEGINGFLGSRASIMLDVVFLAMFLIVPAMAYSIYLVKVKRAYALHKTIQLALGITLLIAVVLFEVDMQWVTGWRDRAKPSPYYPSAVNLSLGIHLCFAIPAALLWIWVIAQGLRKFPDPPTPGPHSGLHKITGWLAAICMTLTALTGWVFYWLAFVASASG